MQADRLKILLDDLDEEPNNPFNVYAVAMEYINTDKKKAFLYLDKLIQDHPEYVATYYHLAALLVDFQEYDKAIEVYKKGIDVATNQNKTNALRELKGAYQMLLDELDE